MTWNFATRDGQLDITGFDGRDFGGTMTAPPGENGFGGFIDDDSNGVRLRQGRLRQRRRRNSPKASWATSSLDDGTWGATGILIGEQVP